MGENVPVDDLSRQQMRVALLEWRMHRERRDSLVRRAVEVGISVNNISKISGIARTTIDRILKEG